MDFSLTPRQLQFRESVRHFAETEVAPDVMIWEQEEELSPEIIAALGRKGYLGSIFPEEYAGLGLGYVEYVTLVEELARVDPSVGLFVASHTSLCSNHVFKFGTEEQRRLYLPKLATGEWIGSWGFTEPGAGSDAAGMRTVARKEGDNWVLNGHKRFTTNAEYASINVVIAITDPARAQHGISAFLVESGNPGRRIGTRALTLGMRASKTHDVFYENCQVPGSHLIGQRGEGFVDCLKVLDGGRISIAALALGVAQGAYEAALHYAQQRQQFGKSIAEFQAIQHKLVDMAVAIESARLLTLRAAVLCDQRVRFSKEAAMAKLAAGDMAVKVADEAVQIHGGYGLLRGSLVEKFYRDAKLCTIGEGTSEIQKLVIARHILKAASPQPEGEAAANHNVLVP